MTNSNSAAALRISLGAIMLAHGLLKLLVFTPAGTVGFFASLGLPAFTAYMVIAAELGLSLTLIFGLYTRLSALLSVPILVGATWVHAGNGWVFSNQGGGWEFPALLVVIALVVAAQGAGAFSLGSVKRLDHHLPALLRV